MDNYSDNTSVPYATSLTLILKRNNSIVKSAEFADKAVLRTILTARTVSAASLTRLSMTTNALTTLLVRNVPSVSKSNIIQLSNPFSYSAAILSTSNASRTSLNTSTTVLCASRASVICGCTIDN